MPKYVSVYVHMDEVCAVNFIDRAADSESAVHNGLLCCCHTSWNEEYINE